MAAQYAPYRVYQQYTSPRWGRPVWEESVRQYLNEKSSVLIGQVAREALHFETNRIGRADQNRIAATLDRLGWKRSPQKDWQGNFPWTRE